MKKITEHNMDSIFVGSAVIDKTRDIKSSFLVEQIRINKEFGSPLTPAMLYNYYVSVCLIRSYDLTKDKIVGSQLGYPEKTIGNVRRKLIKCNWIFFDKFIHKGKAYGEWYIGKEVVERYKLKEGKLSLKEQLDLGVISENDYRLGTSLDNNELPY